MFYFVERFGFLYGNHDQRLHDETLYNITVAATVVAHEPSTTLWDVLTKVKDPTPKNSRLGAVYVR